MSEQQRDNLQDDDAAVVAQNNNNPDDWDHVDCSFVLVLSVVVAGAACMLKGFSTIVSECELALEQLKPLIARFFDDVEKLRVIVNTPLGAVLVVSVSAIVIVLCAIKLYRTVTRARPRSLMGHIARAATPIIIALLVIVLLLVVVCLFSPPGTCTAWAHPPSTAAAIAGDFVDGFIIDLFGAPKEVLLAHPPPLHCAFDNLPHGSVVMPILNGAQQIREGQGRGFVEYAPNYVVYVGYSAAALRRIVLEGLERCDNKLDPGYIRMRMFKWSSDSAIRKHVEHVDFPLKDQKWLAIDKTEVLTFDNAKLLCNMLRKHSKFPAVHMLGHLANQVRPQAYFTSAEKDPFDKKFKYRGGPRMFAPLRVPEKDFCGGQPDNVFYDETVTWAHHGDKGGVCLCDTPRAEAKRGLTHLKCEFSPIQITATFEQINE